MKLTRMIISIGLALLLMIGCSISTFAEESSFADNMGGHDGGAIVVNPVFPTGNPFTNNGGEPYGGAIVVTPGALGATL